MRKADSMPPRGTVDPLFDGHHERPFHELTPVEKLDWLWATMELVHAARRLPGEGRPLPDPTTKRDGTE